MARETAAFALDHEARRLTVLEARLGAQRTRRLVLSWRAAAGGLAVKRMQRRRADAHWRGVLGRALLVALDSGVERSEPGKQAMAVGSLRRLRQRRYLGVSVRQARGGRAAYEYVTYSAEAAWLHSSVEHADR